MPGDQVYGISGHRTPHPEGGPGHSGPGTNRPYTGRSVHVDMCLQVEFRFRIKKVYILLGTISDV